MPHHLVDPHARLQALRGALKNDDTFSGAIGLMVYTTTGRTGVYQMQALMRMVNQSSDSVCDNIQHKIANTHDLLASLPASNWFKRGEDLHRDHKIGDAGVYDLLLHSQGRSYSVDELFDWLQTDNGLHLTFSDVQRGRSPYRRTWCWAANLQP